MCATWTEKGREWKGDGGEEARKSRKMHTISRRKSISSRLCALLSPARAQVGRPPLLRTHGRCARVSCGVSDRPAVLPHRAFHLSLLRPEGKRRARARKWHSSCARTVRAWNSAAVCHRDTETMGKSTNPASRTGTRSSGPRASGLWMSRVCGVASGRGWGGGPRALLPEGSSGGTGGGGPGPPRGIVEPTIPLQSPATISPEPY